MANGHSTIHAPLNHLKDDPIYQDEKAYEIWLETLDPGIPRTNVKFEVVKDVSLTDVRSLTQAELPSLDAHGFEYFHHPFPDSCNIRTADDIGHQPEQRQAMENYLVIMTDLLLSHFGGRKAVCYDWRVRD
jgi:hypothetical protein